MTGIRSYAGVNKADRQTGRAERNFSEMESQKYPSGTEALALSIPSDHADPSAVLWRSDDNVQVLLDLIETA